MEVRNTLISSAIIIGSALLSIKNIDSFIDGLKNTINLESGKVRLGTVYEEHVKTNFEVVDKSNNSTLIDLSAQTKDIYSKVESYVKDQIETVNKNGGVRDENGRKVSWILKRQLGSLML